MYASSLTYLKLALSLVLSETTGNGAGVGGLWSAISVPRGVCWAMMPLLMEGTGGKDSFSRAGEMDAPAALGNA